MGLERPRDSARVGVHQARITDHVGGQACNARTLTVNSLIRAKNSLFGLKKFPVMSFREFGQKARELSGLGHMNRRFAGYICENSLFFPCLTGNSGETGSLETASTTTETVYSHSARDFARNPAVLRCAYQ